MIVGEDEKTCKFKPSANSTSVSAVLKYKVLENAGMVQTDLTQYNDMKREFYQMFTEKVFEDKDLVGMINFDEFLKNIQPFYKMLGATNQMGIFKEDVDTFLFMKYIAAMIFNLNKSMKATTFKQLKQCLKYQVTNPLIYIMLFFSMLERDLEYFFRKFSLEKLKEINNVNLDEFLWSKLAQRDNEKGKDFRAQSTEIFSLLGLFIYLVEEHFVLIVEMIKENRLVKDNTRGFKKEESTMMSTLQKQQMLKEPIKVETDLPKELPEVNEEEEIQLSPTMVSPGVSRKRAYSDNFSADQVASKTEQQKYPFNQNGVLSEKSLGLDSPAIDRTISYKFMMKHKVIYYLPNLYLGKSTLLLWIEMLTKVTSSRKKLKDPDLELKSIITSLKNIKYNLEEITQSYKATVSHVSEEVKGLDSKINDIMSSIVTECEDANSVGDLLNILSDLRHESFTKKLSE